MLLLECWKILCELAPWLLLGMILSGVMQVLLPKNFIRQRFQGTAGVFQAVAVGVPLPLCSCGVVPAGIGLKNNGASDGAAVGFLISTPQTGIDSILVSASLFGWPFAIFKMLGAAVTGIIGGLLADWISPTEPVRKPPETLPMPTAPTRHSLPVIQPGSVTLDDFPVPSSGWRETFWQVWIHGLEIVRSIWVWLVIGIIVSALIQTAVPEDWLRHVGDWGLWPAMLLMLVISIPMYVCATASVPIAAAIVQSGFPPAAAMVFLMAGPATNITTIGAIASRFGWRVMLVYLATIIGGSLVFASLFDGLLTARSPGSSLHLHDHATWWGGLSAVVLLAMIGYFIYQRFFPGNPETNFLNQHHAS